MNKMEDKTTQDTVGSAKEAARDAAEHLKADAEKALGDIKKKGIRGFFDFRHMYFPSIARYLFIVIVLLTAVGMIVGVVLGLGAIFATGFFAGLGAMVGSVITGIAVIFFTRIFFETMLLGFMINEGIQDMRKKSGK